ncbi:MAG: superoxide dismutase family protein [Betaproteobacteria bacterium]|nr:superoxide dismutase family protein [Betaproteobacteria bacterium]
MPDRIRTLPTNGLKGGPDSPERHAGDLGNPNADTYGKATLSLMLDGISVGKGADGVIGRAVIEPAGPDDLRSPANSGGARGPAADTGRTPWRCCAPAAALSARP